MLLASGAVHSFVFGAVEVLNGLLPFLCAKNLPMVGGFKSQNGEFCEMLSIATPTDISESSRKMNGLI